MEMYPKTEASRKWVKRTNKARCDASTLVFRDESRVLMSTLITYTHPLTYQLILLHLETLIQTYIAFIQQPCLAHLLFGGLTTDSKSYI